MDWARVDVILLDLYYRTQHGPSRFLHLGDETAEGFFLVPIFTRQPPILGKPPCLPR